MGKHIKEHERYMIEAWLKDGTEIKEIADRLGKHYNTIYYEIKKGLTPQLVNNWSGKTKLVYLADVAQRVTVERGHNKGRDLKIGNDYAMADYIEHLIKDMRYSPYAVVQSIKKKACFSTDICETTLYKYIDSGLFLNISNKNLPIKGKRRQKYKKVTVKRQSLKKPPEKSIENRPKEIRNRDIYGHWEIDTVYSGKGKDKTKCCLLVLTERMTLDEYVIKMPDRTLSSTVRALDRLERTMGYKAFTERFKTITADNGSEFGNAELMERSVTKKGRKRTTVYFCHPYTSCERGSNENQNKLVRRWIPKGDDIGKHSTEEIQFIQDWVNDYPRKKYNGMSANEFKAVNGIA